MRITIRNRSKGSTIRLRLITLMFAFLIVLSVVSHAQQTNVGTAGATFLTIGVGSKAMGLGNAYTAGCDNVEGLYWNPGAIARVTHSQVGFYTSNWLVGTQLNWVGTVLKLSGSDVIGVSFTHLGYGEEDVNTLANPYRTGEKWKAADMAFGLSYARSLTDRFSIGGTAKYISQSIWHCNASAFAVDLGLLFITQFNDMRIAMSISNFGSDLQFDGKDLYRKIDLDPTHSGNNEDLVAKLKTNAWPLPLVFRTGIMINLYRSEIMRFEFLTDAVRPNNNSEYLNFGLQAHLFDFVLIQGGYNSLLEKKSQENFSFGLGLKYAIPGVGIVDAHYGMQMMDILENVHSFSIGLRF